MVGRTTRWNSLKKLLLKKANFHKLDKLQYWCRQRKWLHMQDRRFSLLQQKSINGSSVIFYIVTEILYQGVYAKTTIK
jgi:hypothetical protein